MFPKITKLNIPELIESARCLETIGKVEISVNNFTYLKINDDYIHKLFPLLRGHKVRRPEYFGSGLSGAHVSIIYPEEDVIVNQLDLNVMHHFTVREIVTAEINSKIYYVILVSANSLLELRKKYGLSELLNFKGYSIDFHITIAVTS